MDYKYYLFKDENYGDIYTNHRNYYNKKQKKERNSVLASTFFKTIFLCLALTLISIATYGLFEVELLLWIALTFEGLMFLFAVLFIVFLYKSEDRTYIVDFKLTKEYADQVDEYKLNRSKRFAQNLFAIIRRYNEIEAKNKKKTKELETIVKLDEKSMEKVVEKIKNILKEQREVTEPQLKTETTKVEKPKKNTQRKKKVDKK